LPQRALDILLVEDSPSDQLLTMEALRKAPFGRLIHIAKDGVEAMQFLRREEPFLSAPTPDLVLLDLHLPRKSGKEVLDELRRDPALCTIPVVVLSTSQAAADVWQSYELHANCYVAKPLELDEFRRVVGAIGSFWSSVVSLPRPPETSR
jgi:two-component system, chemotaxis family, response regulator Rcp1